jgi:hypothetical protein
MRFVHTDFLGQDNGVMKLDAVTQVYAVLSHRWFLRLIQPDVPVVLLDLGANVMAGLSNVYPLTLTGML